MYVTVSGQGKYRVIQFREDTRIPGTKKRKAHVVKTIGNYEKLLAQNPNILEELRAQAKKLTEEKKLSRPLSLELASDVIYSETDVSKPYYFGHGLILQLWKNLKLDSFFADQGRKEDIQPVIDAIFYLLLQRWADSTPSCSSDQGLYAGIEEMSLNKFYEALNILDPYKESLPQHLAGFFSRNTTKSSPRASYYLSPYAFESAKEEEAKKSRSSKEDGNEVPLLMGLLIDSRALPLGYGLFAGKTLDSKTLSQSLPSLKKLHKLDRITLVADPSLHSDHDLSYLCSLGEDFVISYTLIGSSEKFKAMVLDEGLWASVWDEKTGKTLFREKVVEEELSFRLGIEKRKEEGIGGEKKRDHPGEYENRTLPVKIHLTWTAARAAKDRAGREKMMESLEEKMPGPCELKAAEKPGINQFLEMELNATKGIWSKEIIEQAQPYDGYYALITSDTHLSTRQLRDIYSGLEKTEEIFRILKTDLKARSAHVWSDSQIGGYFLLHYLALSMIRYAQYLLVESGEEPISVAKLMEALHRPQVLVQGEYPRLVLTPLRVDKTYLALSRVLGMKALKTSMTLAQFKVSTKLSLSKNLK